MTDKQRAYLARLGGDTDVPLTIAQASEYIALLKAFDYATSPYEVRIMMEDLGAFEASVSVALLAFPADGAKGER